MQSDRLVIDYVQACNATDLKIEQIFSNKHSKIQTYISEYTECRDNVGKLTYTTKNRDYYCIHSNVNKIQFFLFFSSKKWGASYIRVRSFYLLC